jgi:hypothetical protein
VVSFVFARRGLKIGKQPPVWHTDSAMGAPTRTGKARPERLSGAWDQR